MNDTTLILAAHGAHDGSDANRRIQDLADTLARSDAYRTVRTAFRLGTPTFRRAIDDAPGERVILVPVMTADGYYVSLLRSEAQNARTAARKRVTVTPPVGTHPCIPTLVVDRLRTLIESSRQPMSDTAVLVVGHGTRRHANSRTATLRLCDCLRSALDIDQVHAGFIDDHPSIENAAEACTGHCVIVIPFFIGGGYHARFDIPRRLGIPLRIDGSKTSPHAARVGPSTFLLDYPVGAYRELADIIAHLANCHTADEHQSQPGTAADYDTGALPTGTLA